MYGAIARAYRCYPCIPRESDRQQSIKASRSISHRIPILSNVDRTAGCPPFQAKRWDGRQREKGTIGCHHSTELGGHEEARKDDEAKKSNYGAEGNKKKKRKKKRA